MRAGENADAGSGRASRQMSGGLLWPSTPDVAGGYGGDFGRSDGDAEHVDAPEGDRGLLSAVFDSVVKIHCTHSEPDYLMPWQRVRQWTSSSSGFVVDVEGIGRRVLTNAHSVDYGSMSLVQRRGAEKKYPAVVEAIGSECDLALLRVEEEDFWAGADGGDGGAVPALRFGPLPRLQDEVDVLGYPTGGDSLSVTSGVVSRTEMQEYVHAGMSLLAVQIDAAINSGNSGGPVVNARREVVGVAFQSLGSAENIGYVVPVTVVRHFLEDVRRHRGYTGFCSLGVKLNLLQNAAFRKSLGLRDGTTGVAIRSVDPTFPAATRQLLRASDVITAADGIPVANDGKIPFRHGERVSLACYVQTKFVGDSVRLDLLRDGRATSVDLPVAVRSPKLPAHWNDAPPPYLVVSGLVFTVLSVPLLKWRNAWGGYVSDDISYLLGLRNDYVEQEGDQVVVLAQVLAHRENLGYDKYMDLHLVTYNGAEVRSLRHLHRLIRSGEEEFMRFEFAGDGPVIVLERSTMEEVTREVCGEHGIREASYLPTKEETTDVSAEESS